MRCHAPSNLTRHPRQQLPQRVMLAIDALIIPYLRGMIADCPMV
jgi:hypothetical protein